MFRIKSIETFNGHNVCEYFESVDLIKSTLGFTYSKFTPDIKYDDRTSNGIVKIMVDVHINDPQKNVDKFAIEQIIPKNRPDHL